MSENELTTEELRESYAQAFQRELAENAVYKEELKEKFTDVDADDPEVAKQAREELIKLVPDAGARIIWLLNHAESEAIQKDLAKFIFQVAIKAAEISGEEDEMQRIIKSLSRASN